MIIFTMPWYYSMLKLFHEFGTVVIETFITLHFRKNPGILTPLLFLVPFDHVSHYYSLSLFFFYKYKS